jgi:hypothetical protein
MLVKPIFKFVNSFGKKNYDKFFQFVIGFLLINGKNLPELAIMVFGVNPSWQRK